METAETSWVEVEQALMSKFEIVHDDDSDELLANIDVCCRFLNKDRFKIILHWNCLLATLSKVLHATVES